MAMPTQRFDRAPMLSTMPQADGDALAHRILLILLTLILATAASSEMRHALFQGGYDSWKLLLLLLFSPLFGWIAFGFVGTAVGFTLLMTRAHGGYVPPPSPSELPKGRTAILMPIHNEDVDAVFARIDAMIRSITAVGAERRFDFFVLSDSGVKAAPLEKEAWLRHAVQSPVRLFYRRRTQNIARKPGNIAEWVQRFGGAYDYMLVLDADSLMSGRTMLAMAAAMEARPSIGLLQTVPRVIGAQTLFQRWMQFSSHLYGPIASAGLLWWSGSEATFWGHNAMLRTSAFAESCGLPELSGRPPFGGHIMSHDMVEAALLRRRGWEVRMILTDGSYEEFPPTVIDHAIRDRRWAQGNIQHLRLLLSSGFHWVNRLQLLVGASAYITSPLWLLMIIATIVQQLRLPGDTAGVAPTGMVLALTVALLFGPKLMGLIWGLRDPETRRAFGGGRTLARSVLADVLLSMLMAPMTMITQTINLIDIIRGRPSGWAAQNRDGGNLTLRDAARAHRWHLATGLAFVAIAPVAPIAALWLIPVTLGLLASPWLAVWTSRVVTGSAEAQLFTTPVVPYEPILRIAHPSNDMLSADLAGELPFPSEDSLQPALSAG